MGQGQDKIARTLLELQPTAIVELFLIYFNPGEYENAFFAFHGGSLFQKPITWQGLEYLPVPVETEGFEINANGRIARPKIRISNKDYIMTDLLLGFKDLQFAKIIRKRTFVKYLDNINFDGGNPWGQSDYNAELSNDTFIVSQKTAENKLFVELELTYPLDIDGANVNSRLILGSYCSFTYRGEGCNYKGIPLTNSKNENLKINARSLGNFIKNNPNDFFKWRADFNYEIGDIVYFENQNNPINYFRGRVLDDEPEYERIDSIDYLKTYYVAKREHISTLKNSPIGTSSQLFWEKDQCHKSLDACKKRFNENTEQVISTQTIEEVDKFLDFSTNKIQKNDKLKLISNESSFFPKNFYRNKFTIAMWISFPKAELKNNTNHSIFTNAKTSSSVCLNYYIRNGKLRQLFRIIDSNGDLSDTAYIETSNLLSYDSSYQFCLFEYDGKEIKVTLNNDEESSGSYELDEGESFAFTNLNYLNNYFSNTFQINGNDYWGGSNINTSTLARIHSVIVWSRNLNSSEKKWLYRDENNLASIETTEIKSPRRLQEINAPYDSIKNNAILWLQDNISTYDSKNKKINFYSEILQEQQSSQSVYFSIDNLNYDITNTLKNTLIYQTKYTKEASNWLPFGGFPATIPFSFQGAQN
jgi:lambda family phage minor tail protein L